MTTLSSHTEDLKQRARYALHAASPWIEALARMGYAAKGVVYLLVGFLALMAARGTGDDVEGSRGALAQLLESWGMAGKVALIVIAAGLAGYSMWCFIRAVEDPEGLGNDAKGIGKRGVRFITGIIYAALFVYTIGLITGQAVGGDDGHRGWVAMVMSYPLGRWAVFVTGICVAGKGISGLWRAWKVKLDEELSLSSLSAAVRRWIIHISRFGLFARSIVFGIIGYFFIAAALHFNPNEAKDIGDALRYLQGKPHGRWLLGVVALGLTAYAVYEFVRARYRRIETV